MNDIQTKADQAYEQIKAHPELPSPTGVALAILDLAKSEDCDIHELGRVVESDPAIASRVLRYVNSAAVRLVLQRRLAIRWVHTAPLDLRNPGSEASEAHVAL